MTTNDTMGGERKVDVIDIMIADAEAANYYRLDIDADRGKSAKADSIAAIAAVNDLIKSLCQIEKMCEGQTRGIVVHIDKIAHDALARIGGTP